MTLFFVHEEESPVLPNRPADPTTIAIIPPFRIFNGPVVSEPVVGVQFVILVIPVTGAVPVIRAASRNHLHLGAKRPGKVHAGVVRLHPELFQAFYGSGYYRSGGSLEARIVAAAALHVAGGVATIEHEGVLVHPRPGYRSAARVALTRSAGSVETWNRHGLEQHQGSGIPAQRRH